MCVLPNWRDTDAKLDMEANRETCTHMVESCILMVLLLLIMFVVALSPTVFLI